MDDGHYITELILRETEADVTRVYRQATEEMQKKVEDYFRKYQVKDLIKRDQLLKGEITQADYNYWKTGQLMIGKRWEEMRDSLAQDLHNANDLARSTVLGHMPDVYATNHNYGTFQVEKESLVDTSYTLYDRQTVERLIREQPDVLPAPGKQMREKIAANKDIAWQKGQIQSVTMQSILQGESIPNMAKRICNTLNEKNRKATVRYARTATTAAENAGRIDSYKRAEDMGIDLEQEWLATLDGRTRHEHRQLDGQHVPVGEPFKVGGTEIRYPGDPSAPGYLVWNCRCTLVPRLKNLDQSDAPRNSRLGSMTYEEWKTEHSYKYEVNIPGVQGDIGRATTIQQVNDVMNNQGWFRTIEKPSKGAHFRWDEDQMKYIADSYDYIPTKVDLTGCDLESAKSIASSYQQIFEKYPQLKGRFDAPVVSDLGKNTYAQCWYDHGKVEVNSKYYRNWQSLVRSYESDILSRWHPQGTTAESIITHELGHAIDGLITDKRILGGYNSAGEFNRASSFMRASVMRSCGFKVSDTAQQVSRYASKNPQEWFAECFAEYITSADPRPVAKTFGKRLEELLEKLV